ncbi:MAG: glycerol-3-phosphate 1-O-acyltransferase PlsY [Eubacteriales bacterium]|nr:glycerol-3-phosphate 1-O-acyltransferase PlsY [Eubacteriales bacterium]
MKVLAFFLAAVVPYLVAGVNPSILLSKLVYRQDIRTVGSKNPGFTNFKRMYGWKLGWLVFAFDLCKGILACVLAGLLFRHTWGSFQLGAAYGALFAMLGHAYPVWYGFRGGKTVTVWLSSIWFIDWRAGLIAVGVFLLILFTIKFMSLSSMSAGIAFLIALGFIGTSHPAVLPLCAAAVLLLIWRHKTNIERLLTGTESRFSLFGKGKQKREETEKS